VLLVAATGVIAWRPTLRSLGALLTVADSVQQADIAVMTSETELDGELELADLFAERTVARVGVLTHDPSPAEREFKRRGIPLEDSAQILVKLGVPASAIVLIAAGEGGTTEGTAALARWCLANRIHRVLMVTSANHSRRVQRALRRAFQHRGPIVLVHTPRSDPFRPLDWWEDRTTLRSGLVELEKLLLDYLRHPIG
jgi:uncharacterized SAM-binding protein YcdF (DUF218 family)